MITSINFVVVTSMGHVSC